MKYSEKTKGKTKLKKFSNNLKKMRERKKKDIRVCDSKKKYKKLDKIYFDI
ncbi:MAG: hypothetical protein SOY42_02420 [Clostridium sp.]|nr:hypothetical protein [Clostridium sp.]